MQMVLETWESWSRSALLTSMCGVKLSERDKFEQLEAPPSQDSWAKSGRETSGVKRWLRQLPAPTCSYGHIKTSVSTWKHGEVPSRWEDICQAVRSLV